MISKKSIKVIKDIYNYINSDWVTMEWDWDSETKHSKEFMEGFKKAKEDAEKANKRNFGQIKYLLTGLNKEIKDNDN